MRRIVEEPKKDAKELFRRVCFNALISNIDDHLPYHKFAELIGLKGIFVDQADRVGPAWEEALDSKRPVVLEMKTDPNVPPLPPHITLEQAKKFASTLLKGDPDEGSVILGAARQVLSSVLPGRKD